MRSKSTYTLRRDARGGARLRTLYRVAPLKRSDPHQRWVRVRFSIKLLLMLGVVLAIAAASSWLAWRSNGTATPALEQARIKRAHNWRFRFSRPRSG
jgi:hypothetical protein